MINVYYYGIDNNNGGMENFAFSFITENLKRYDKYKFSIISEYEDFAFKNEFINEYNCKSIILPSKRKHPILYKNKLKKIIKNIVSDDIFICNIMSYHNFLLFHELKKAKCKVFIIGHSSGNGKIDFIHPLFRRHYRRIGTKIAPSFEAQKFMFKKTPSFVVPTGINYKKYVFNKEKRDQIRKDLNIKSDEIVVGQFGRISFLKNQSFTIKLFSTKKITYRMLFVGKILDNKQLKNIENINAIHLDEVNNVEDYYSIIDLLIVPSIHEGLPLVILEASASGLPIFCSNNVPKINSLENIKYLPLNIDVWADAIESYNFVDINRSNYLVNTDYTTEKWINSLNNIIFGH